MSKGKTTNSEARHLKALAKGERYGFEPWEEEYVFCHWDTLTDRQMAEYLECSRIRVEKFRIRKGLVKGQKFAHHLAPGARLPCSAHFKKGQPSWIAKPDGTIVERNFNDGRKYKFIRLAPMTWKGLHVHVWEQHNGPVPANHVIAFKNGDTLDCRIENLHMISRSELALRNSGSLNLSDTYVAGIMARKNPELKLTLLELPDLLDLKRTSILLNRAIKHASNSETPVHGR